MSSNFEILDPVYGKLVVRVSGRSTVQDAARQYAAVFAELSDKIKRVEFDLSDVDPVNNIAGRFVDLAAILQGKYDKEVLLKVPTNVAHGLIWFDVGESPKAIDGVPIRLTAPSKNDTVSLEVVRDAGEAALGKRVVLSCAGKVRHIGGESVTVSLYIKNEEVIGELKKVQFPHQKLEVGTIFQYEALVIGNGLTEIKITFDDDRILTPDAVVALYLEAKEAVPEDEF